jgi:hypothetical protein
MPPTTEELERKRRKTRNKLGRPRKRRRMVNLDQQPTLDESLVRHHDVLVITPAGVSNPEELFRFPVVRMSGGVQGGLPDEFSEDIVDVEEGSYVDAPEKLDFYDYTQRKTISFARPHDWGARGSARGPAFATLPVKPEPSADFCGLCYMINTQNLNFRNAWTAEEWSQVDGLNLLPSPTVDAEAFDVLLAGPQGRVFWAHIELGKRDTQSWKLGERRQLLDENGKSGGFVECLDLRYQSEIWNQLRNGCVLGRALLEQRFTRAETAKKQIVPLVNVTTLMPEEEGVR